jgi:hypothetical protein
MLNFLKHNRKLMNAGALKEDRVVGFSRGIQTKESVLIMFVSIFWQKGEENGCYVFKLLPKGPMNLLSGIGELKKNKPIRM